MFDENSEASPVIEAVTKHLQIEPVREISIGKVRLTEFSDKSRLYEFHNDANFVLYLTPEGVSKYKESSRDLINSVKESGNLGEGKIIHSKPRSIVTEYQHIGIVGKESGAGKFDKKHIRRLNELANMVNISKKVKEINATVEEETERIRLETPNYYAFASWDAKDGERRQAIFMDKVNHPYIGGFDFMKDTEIFRDFQTVANDAKERGINIVDTAGNAFVRKNEGSLNTYIIIDQA